MPLTSAQLTQLLTLLREASSAVGSGRHEDLILTLGVTGVGKSTLVNYCNGVTYKILGRYGHKVRTEPVSGTELAAVSHEPISETKLPQVFKLPVADDSIHLVDLPGFAGNNSKTVELAALMSTQRLLQEAESVKGLLFVIDLPSISQGRGGSFEQQALQLYTILRGCLDDAITASLNFVITKCPPGVTVDNIIEHDIQQSYEHLHRLFESGDLESSRVGAYHVLKFMLQHRDKILIPDVTKADAREVLLASMQAFPGIPKRSISLTDVDQNQQEFLRWVESIVSEFKDSVEQASHCKAQIQRCEDEAARYRQRKAGVDREKQRLSARLGEMRRPEYYQELIRRDEAEIERIKAEVRVAENEKLDLQRRIERICSQPELTRTIKRRLGCFGPGVIISERVNVLSDRQEKQIDALQRERLAVKEKICRLEQALPRLRASVLKKEGEALRSAAEVAHIEVHIEDLSQQSTRLEKQLASSGAEKTENEERLRQISSVMDTNKEMLEQLLEVVQLLHLHEQSGVLTDVLTFFLEHADELSIGRRAEGGYSVTLFARPCRGGGAAVADAPVMSVRELMH